ncbi:hypothetical protein [Brevibacillus sp. 179-C9.3 HS]|uniref:hypothetical protein n=1 Tax=unclassified Brevibacillus TaxID=2684853 RepID=UPI0039A3BED6
MVVERGCSGGRSVFPVYASAYAPQGGLTGRFGKNGGSASNVEASKKYSMSEAEIPRHSFLRWDGLQRRLDWKSASSYAAYVKHDCKSIQEGKSAAFEH